MTRLRVVHAIEWWVLWFYLDIFGPDKRKDKDKDKDAEKPSDMLHDFIDNVLANAGMPGAYDELNKALAEAEKSINVDGPMAGMGPCGITPIPPATVPAVILANSSPPSPLLPFSTEMAISNVDLRPGSFDVFDFHPIEVARQLTLMDFELYRAIRPRELIGLAWNGKRKKIDSPNVSAMIKRFNRMSLWSSTLILGKYVHLCIYS